MSCDSEAVAQLREAGFRLTPQRMMVLEAIYHSAGHLTAEEVHLQVRAISSYVDLSTIYRTLQFLKQNLLIGELRLEGEPIRYEALHSGKEHHHAICSACGTVLEIDPADLDALKASLLQNYGFQANLVHINLPGLCAHCVVSSYPVAE